MLSQQQIHDNIALFAGIDPDDSAKICSIVLDSIQYHTNLQAQIDGVEIADETTRRTIADTIYAIVFKLLQAKSSAGDCTEALSAFGFDDEHVSALASVINSRLGGITRDLASQSSGDRLTDLEWRFGLTAASSSGTGTPFVQMRLEFEKFDPVTLEMGLSEFYEFATDIKKIQAQMHASLASE